MLTTLALTLSLVLPTAELRVALLPFTAAGGAEAGTAHAVGEALAGELRRQGGLAVLTSADLRAVMSQKELEQMLGCADERCLAGLSGSVGADEVVTGTLSKLGESWLMHVSRVDVRAIRTVASVDRRFRSGRIDDVLDALPAVVTELLAATAAASAPARVAPPEASAAASVDAKAVAEGGRDQAYVDAALAARLTVLTDGQGHYFAYDAAAPRSDLFFAGDAQALYQQRIIGSSSEGERARSFVFWEPRFAPGWQRAFDARDGVFKLQCGERTVPLDKLAEPQRTALLAKARLLTPRWQRYAYLLARDEAGTYYFVDNAREPERAEDYRLFVGRKGRLRALELDDVIVDAAGTVFLTAEGRLAFRQAGDAAWVGPSGEVKLTPLVVHDEAPMIYGKLGVYAGQRLGSACDGLLR